MVPTDGSFHAYTGPQKPASGEQYKSPLNGRIFVLKFSSSSERHFFWLQSREQPAGDPSHFSPRDLKLGEIVHNLLQGGELNNGDISSLRNGENGGPDGADHEDALMEDVQDHDAAGAGGAGAGATGGDVREEGEESREGGADGGRANLANEDQNETIRRLLAGITPPGQQQQQPQAQEKLSTTLPDLLSPPDRVTIPALTSSSASEQVIDDILLNHLPPRLLNLHVESESSSSDQSSSDQEPSALLKAMSLGTKKTLLARVLRSPQFMQSLSTITSALRDGGLPSVSEAMGVPAEMLENGGYVNRNAGIPMSGGHAMETFLAGLKSLVEIEEEARKADEEL
ncbi:MAG: hypothetical protein M1831_006902 [Alyxoria varia]|nr:MAG: hypothetical protein M1831_006902 [Alyxoria varia]